MKTKLTRISKRTIAFILTILMMISVLGIGTLITVNAAASITSDGTAYIFYDCANGFYDSSGTKKDWWPGYNWVVFRNGKDNETNQKFVQPTTTDSSHHAVKVPSGTWTHIFLYRGNGANWDLFEGNQTWEIALDSTKNYLTKFQQGSTTHTWSTYCPAPSAYTIKATSPSSTTSVSISTGSSVTFGKNTFTSTYSTFDSISSYRVTNSSGTSVSTGYTISGNTITFNTAGTYRVYGTLKYHANGFTSITSSKESSNYITVTVTKPSHNVKFSQPANGEIKVNDSTVSPQSVAEGNSYTVKVTPDSGYKIKSLNIAGSDYVNAVGKTETYTVTKEMETSDVTVTATFEQNQPVCSSVTLTQTPSGTVYKGTEYTFTANAVDAVDGVNYHFYLDGSSVQNTSSNTYKHTFTDTKSHSIYVQVEKTGYASVKSNTLTFTPSDSQASATKNVTYYIDLHDNNPTTNPTIKFSSGSAHSLAKQGKSTVYSATVSTPYIYDAQNGDKDTAIADIPATVSCDGCEYSVTIGKKAITTGEAWLESIGALKKDTIDTTTTTATNSSKKRIYLAKQECFPGDTNNYNSWTKFYVHWYNDAGGASGWGDKDSNYMMKYIGEYTNSSSEKYYVYYYDVLEKDISSATKFLIRPMDDAGNYIEEKNIPKNLENKGELETLVYSESNNMIWLNRSTDHTYSFSHATVPSISEYYSNVTIQKDSNYSIVPQSHTGTLSYSVSSGSSHVSCSTAGRITANSAGTAKVTITAKGTYGDTVSVTTTITVKEPATLGSLKAMSYKSVSSKFSVENGTFNDNAISTVLTGSEATGNKDATLYNCGIITQSGNEYTVKYAENEAETGYNLLRLTVTVSASPNDGYGFDGWYVGGEKSSQYKNEGDAITVDGNDYTLKYTEQTKWKVNITYNYDLYDNSKINYYDEANAENDIQKEYKVEGIEFVGNALTEENYTEFLIHNGPDLVNDYYEYHLVSTAKSDAEPDGYVVSTDNAQNTCTITANLKKTVRTYTVYLNGDIRRAGLTYQEPFTIQSGEVSGFNSNQNLIWKDDGKEVATGTSYSFRVTGDMYITAEENKDGVTFNGKSIIAHRSFDVNTAMKQLVHNFYIADFYNDDLGSYVDFVGGGALYFAMNDETGKPTKAKGAVDDSGEAIEGKLAEVVERVAGGGKDYYNDQLNVTDNDTNIVCRYLKYDKHKELFKYSDELQAYQYIYSPSFLNDDQYKNYSLRVYSYFIYEDLDEGTYIISVSDDHADAKLYEVGK